MLFDLHAEDFCLARKKTDFELVGGLGGAVGLLDHVGVEGRDGYLLGFALFLILHYLIITIFRKSILSLKNGWFCLVCFLMVVFDEPNLFRN